MKKKKPSTIGEIKERCLSKPNDTFSVPFDDIDSVVKDLVRIYLDQNKLLDVSNLIMDFVLALVVFGVMFLMVTSTILRFFNAG